MFKKGKFYYINIKGYNNRTIAMCVGINKKYAEFNTGDIAYARYYFGNHKGDYPYIITKVD